MNQVVYTSAQSDVATPKMKSLFPKIDNCQQVPFLMGAKVISGAQ
jgi:hypothetical protein